MDGHIRIDGRGVPYVGKTRLKLIHLVMSYQDEGCSAESLREVYEWLPVADLYGALAYYLDHREEVEGAIKEYHERSQALQKEGIPFAGIVYAQQQQVAVGDLVEDLCLVSEATDEAYWESRVEFLPL